MRNLFQPNVFTSAVEPKFPLRLWKTEEQRLFHVHKLLRLNIAQPFQEISTAAQTATDKKGFGMFGQNNTGYTCLKGGNNRQIGCVLPGEFCASLRLRNILARRKVRHFTKQQKDACNKVTYEIGNTEFCQCRMLYSFPIASFPHYPLH